MNLGLVKKHKLYIADIKERLLPALDLGKTYPQHNLYWITSETWDLRVLGALLMSAVGEFFIHCYGVRMRGGYLRFQAQYLRRIRVPDPHKLSPKLAETLSQAFETQDFELATVAALEAYGLDQLPALADTISGHKHMIFVQDEEKPSNPPKLERVSPHFAIYPEFKTASYQRRMAILCEKMVQEGIYDSAAAISSPLPLQSKDSGKFEDISENVTFRHLLVKLRAHIQAEVSLAANGG